MATGSLLAVSDLHLGYEENREVVRSLAPRQDGDWLIIAGDLAEKVEDIEWGLRLAAERFSTVVWVPGNHELWTHPDDPVRLRGEARYRHLVRICRGLGVLTPEDPFPVWEGPDGPLTVAPLFVLYDYSFLSPGTTTKEESLRVAREAGVVCTDEYYLHPDPRPDRETWCRDRVAWTEERLKAVDPTHRTVLVNHFPLVRDPTRVLLHPEFSQWCGTRLTADWHRRFRAAAVIYGHLHIPRVSWHDGVRFEEVSLGYPREWRPRPHRSPLREVLPGPAPRGGPALLEEVVLRSTAVAEAFEDPLSEPLEGLDPAEAAVVARAVPRRQHEFATVRRCARRAMAALGQPAVPLLPGHRGAPQWPDGLVGSMTHCDGYRAAAVARRGLVRSVGIDAEPNLPLPDGVLDTISSPAERTWISDLLRERPEVRWDRLLFSAKESVFKAWYPRTGRELEFDEAVVQVDPDAHTFTARLLVPSPVLEGRRVDTFEGRWVCRDGLIVTAVTILRLPQRAVRSRPRALLETPFAPGPRC
ncbi:MAG: hypothetical protein QG608_2315 [Actinomycetota bacterium]|nr:hypothetical protein [Actinomycetota bacterium]